MSFYPIPYRIQRSLCDLLEITKIKKHFGEKSFYGALDRLSTITPVVALSNILCVICNNNDSIDVHGNA